MDIRTVETPLAHFLSGAGAVRTGSRESTSLLSGELFAGYIRDTLSLLTADFRPLLYFKLPASPERDACLKYSGSLNTSTGMDIEFGMYEADSVPPSSSPISFLKNMNLDSAATAELQQYAPLNGYTPPPSLPKLCRFNLNSILPSRESEFFRLAEGKVYIIGFYNNNSGTVTTGAFSARIALLESGAVKTEYIAQ